MRSLIAHLKTIAVIGVFGLFISLIYWLISHDLAPVAIFLVFGPLLLIVVICFYWGVYDYFKRG